MGTNENFRRHRESGWQRNNRLKQPPAIMPESPCKWHLFLYGLGIKEDEVRGSLPSDLRRKVIEWARRHADQCYIPADLLRDAGIRTRYDS